MTRSRNIVLLSSALWLAAASAHAHIRLDGAGTHESRDGDAQKAAPCGTANSKRGTKIYTYEPGETIEVSVSEYVPHPGYFRIAFDQDGDDSFKDPVSIDPIDTTRQNQGATDNDKGSDFCNNETVLMDNVDPHLSAGLSGLTNPKVWTWQVKLPDVECDNCTLQILQIMEDPAGHGAFDGKSDIYHQCVDIVLKRKDGAATPTGAFPECTIGQRIMGQVGGSNVTPSKPDAGTAKDAGSTSEKDAGTTVKKDASAPDEPADDPEQGADDDDDEASADHDEHAHDAHDDHADAGRSSSTKKDASTSSRDEDDEEDDAPSASKDGCAVSGSSALSSWAFLLAAAFLVRRARASRGPRSRRPRSH